MLTQVHVLRRDPLPSDDGTLGYRVGDIAENLLTGNRFYMETEGGGWLPFPPAGGSIGVTDGSSTVPNATTLSFPGASVSDAGGGTAEVAISGGGTILGFGQDTGATTGLTFGLLGGRIIFDANADISTYVPGTVTLFDNTSNFLTICPDLGDQISDAVVVQDNNVSNGTVPIGNWALFNVITVDGNITDVVDIRTTISTAFTSTSILTDFSFVKAETDDDVTFHVTLKGGTLATISGPISNTIFFVDVPNNSTKFIEIDSSGNVVATDDAFTPGRFPLFVIEIDAGVSHVFDARAFMSFPNGASGSFTSNDGKTVTVLAGIITDIAGGGT